MSAGKRRRFVFFHLFTMQANIPLITNGIPIYASGDPRTAFNHRDAHDILQTHGYPKKLLTDSAKIEKCGSVGVFCRVLYLTPGLFCPSSTPACRAGCLGHTSGHMPMPGPTLARDQRSAFYIEDRELFIEQLKDEIATVSATAARKGAQPAIRLNGTSDILWERVHPDIFTDFPNIQFYDYTKVRVRMPGFASGTLGSKAWPNNYHLTFSGDGSQPDRAKAVLNQGGNVAFVFWPDLPQSWLGFPVIDGDTHDARFLDPAATIVGLRAKGFARVDSDGFVVRCCPHCGSATDQMRLSEMTEDTHRQMVHECERCDFRKTSRWILPQSSKCGIRDPHA